MTKTLEEVEKFIELRAKGYSFDKIAQETGVSKPTLLKWQGEQAYRIKQAQYYELENIVNQYGLTRKERFEAHSILLSSALQELKERAKNNQLSRIPADKLLSLVLSLKERIEKDTKKELLSVHKDKSMEFMKIMNEEFIEVE